MINGIPEPKKQKTELPKDKHKEEIKEKVQDKKKPDVMKVAKKILAKAPGNKLTLEELNEKIAKKTAKYYDKDYKVALTTNIIAGGHVAGWQYNDKLVHFTLRVFCACQYSRNWRFSTTPSPRIRFTLANLASVDATSSVKTSRLGSKGVLSVAGAGESVALSLRTTSVL